MSSRLATRDEYRLLVESPAIAKQALDKLRSTATRHHRTNCLLAQRSGNKKSGRGYVRTKLKPGGIQRKKVDFLCTSAFVHGATHLQEGYQQRVRKSLIVATTPSVWSMSTYARKARVSTIVEILVNTKRLYIAELMAVQIQSYTTPANVLHLVYFLLY